MQLYINGEKRQVDGVSRLHELLAHFKVRPAAVVTEHNQKVVAPELRAEVLLQDGDTVEIVQFVGGGSDGEPPEAPVPPDKPAFENQPPAGKPASENQPPAGDAVPAPVKRKSNTKKAAAKPRKKTDGEASKKPARKGTVRYLVVVESPAKAKTINKFLGNEYQVEASLGHVRDLPKSKMGIDIEHGFEPHYIVLRKAQKTVTHLRKQARSKDAVFLAPDPDREGEAISWHLAHIFREDSPDKKIARVVFNEITKEAVQESFRHPRDISMNVVDAQQARRVLDRVVGYELSPLLWNKVGRGLSAGRVQSVALRLIVEREREIRKFVPEEYWTLDAKLSSNRSKPAKIFGAHLDKIDGQKPELKTGEETQAVRSDLEKAVFVVESVDKSERRRKPQAPYTTSKLQQESFSRLGFSAVKTMRTAQHLYEGVELGDEGTIGLITYMRTDSVNVAESARTEAAEYIGKKFGKNFLPEKPPVYKAKKGAQEAHEAIRPSSAYREPEKIRAFLNDDEFKLYSLIWRKFMASQMAPAVDEQLSVVIAAGKRYQFKSTGRRNLFPGFSVVYEEVRAPEPESRAPGAADGEAVETGGFEEIPELTAGEALELHELLGEQHFTKPPARFNDASLVKILEEKGIGRPSTYAPTLGTLLERDYAMRQSGALHPTELGETVVGLLIEHFPQVMDIQFTAQMEDKLDQVEEGTVAWKKVIEDFYGPFKKNIDAAHETMKNVRREAVPTQFVCDICGKTLLERWGRFGKFLACSGFPECKYTRPLPTGFRCPQEGCGGDLVKRKSRVGRIFYGCSRYPQCTFISNKLPKPDDAPETPGAAPEGTPAPSPAPETPKP